MNGERTMADRRIDDSSSENLALYDRVNQTEPPVGVGTAIHPGAASGYLITNPENLRRLSDALGESFSDFRYVYCVDEDGCDDFAHLRRASALLSMNPSPNSWCAVQAKSEGIATVIGVVGELYHHAEVAPVVETEFELQDESTVSVEIVGGKHQLRDAKGMAHVLREGELVTVDGHDGAIYRGLQEMSTSRVTRLYRNLAGVIVSSVQAFGHEQGWSRYRETSAYQAARAELVEALRDPEVAGLVHAITLNARTQRPSVTGTVHTARDVARSRLLSSLISLSADGEDVCIERCDGLYGVGLLRTERLFSGQRELDALRLLILGQDVVGDQSYEESIEVYRTFLFDSYMDLCRVNAGGLCVVRTLCMPNNKLFPSTFDAGAFANRHGLSADAVREALHGRISEAETFHGTRGTRLHVQREDLARAEIEAYLLAVAECERIGNTQEFLLLMSMVTFVEEVAAFVDIVDDVARDLAGKGHDVSTVNLASMVETTGAYLGLEDLCRVRSECCRMTGFLFGGNDFTAAVLNMNRHDSVRGLIPEYLRRGLFSHNPFIRLDPRVAGAIFEGIKRIRAAAGVQKIRIGFGGEQAADLETVRLLAEHVPGGIDFVTTSPDRATGHCAAGVLRPSDSDVA